MSLISGVDGLQVVPLTDSLADIHEVLKRARDQV